MASYLGLVLRTAFRRWDNRTDLASGVLGALVPCGFVLAGQPVPENVSLLVAEIAVGIVVSTIIVRLLAAPYLIWLSDQEKIKELQRKLDDPVRRRREAFEEGMQKSRAEFAVEIRKYLHGYNASFIRHNFNEAVLTHLNNYACLFTEDGFFSGLWDDFVAYYKGEAEVVNIPLDIPDPDGFWEVQINQNLNYYAQSRQAVSLALIRYLTYVEDYDKDLEKSLSDIHERYKEIGRVDILRSARLSEALASRSPSAPPSETKPESRLG